MNNPLAITVSASLRGLLPLALAACLDFVPITSVAGNAEGGADGGSAQQTACLTCASGDEDAGGCAAEFAQCNGFPACSATISCVVGHCFDPNANIGMCLAGCEEDGGISSSSGPPNTAFASFLRCMSTRCQSMCLP